MAKKSEPSFKDLLKQLVKSNETLNRIEKSADSTLKKLKQPLKIDDKRDANVDQLSAKTLETPKIIVDNKIEVPEIKVPKITVDVLMDSSKKKGTDNQKKKTQEKQSPYLKCCESILSGVNVIASETTYAGGMLKSIYLEIQKTEALLEVVGGAIVNDLGKFAGVLDKRLQKLAKGKAPSKEELQQPASIKDRLVGAGRKITGGILEKVMPTSILGAEKGKKVKGGKDKADAGPLERMSEAVKGLGTKAGKAVEKFLGGLADSVSMFGERKVVQGSKSLLMLSGSLAAVAGSLVLFNKVKLSSFVKAIAAMTGLVALAKYVATMKAKTEQGAKIVLFLSASLLAAATGLMLFSKVDWSSLGKAVLALTGLIGFAVLVGKIKGSVKNGATAILALSASLLAASVGLLLFAFVDWKSIITASATLLSLIGIAVLIGKLKSDVLEGALTIFTLSASLVVAAAGLLLFSLVDWPSIAKAGVALLGLVGIAALIGKLAPEALLGAITIGILSASLLVAATGLMLFSKVDWPAIIKAGVVLLGLVGIATLISASGGVLALLGAAAGITALGLSLIVAGEGIKTIGNGFDKLANGMKKLAEIKGKDLVAVAAGITGISAAMVAFAFSGVAAGIANLVTSFLSIGRDSPVDQLLKLGQAGDGIQKAADGMNALAAAMERFSKISPDSMKAINDFPWLKAAAFAAAGGLTMTVDGVTVTTAKAAEQSNARLITPQDNVTTSNLTGATMVQYQKQTDEATAAAAATPTIVVPGGGGGGNKANVTNASVSNVTYNSNNIPDRTMNYLQPAYGF